MRNKRNWGVSFAISRKKVSLCFASVSLRSEIWGHPIHDSLSVDFLKILGAGDWQEDMLRNGLVFQWKAGPPGPYQDKNNKSALNHLPQLRDTVATWEKAGLVERLSEPSVLCAVIR